MQHSDVHPGLSSVSVPGDGSRTLTLTTGATRNLENENDDEVPRVVGTLKLRGAHKKKKQGKTKVAWDEGVVDNEGCGKKKSKICCIYHKPRRFDESSDESSDSDASDSECAHDSPAGDVSRRRSPSIVGSNVINTLEFRDDDAEPNAYEASHSSSKKMNK